MPTWDGQTNLDPVDWIADEQDEALVRDLARAVRADRAALVGVSYSSRQLGGSCLRRD
jgi:hypothetical protein